MKIVSLTQFSLITVFILVLLTSTNSLAEVRLCLENICVGDDVDALDVEWKKVKIDYKTNRAVKGLLADKTIDELYYEFNELLITDTKTKGSLASHVIQLQRFDKDVLKLLKKVRAVCTPLSLTGEVENNSRTKLFVTFRAIANNGGRGLFRVVQIEKEFNIFPPHIRPTDKEKYVSMVEVLKKDYPELLMVRDIDSRTTANELSYAGVILGYRFYSDVYAPLTFRIRDVTDIESIDVNPKRSSLCPVLEY